MRHNQCPQPGTRMSFLIRALTEISAERRSVCPYKQGRQQRYRNTPQPPRYPYRHCILARHPTPAAILAPHSILAHINLKSLPAESRPTGKVRLNSNQPRPRVVSAEPNARVEFLPHHGQVSFSPSVLLQQKILPQGHTHTEALLEQCGQGASPIRFPVFTLFLPLPADMEPYTFSSTA